MKSIIRPAVALALVGPAFAQGPWVWNELKVAAGDAGGRDHFGASVSVSGDTALVGAPLEGLSDTGAAYVFQRAGTTWVEVQKLTASAPGVDDEFGRSVAVEGDTALVGAPLDDDAGIDRGSVTVFVRSGTTWSEETVLTASDGGGRTGTSVAISGDTALVGAPSGGAAYVFLRSGTVWNEQAKLVAAGVVSQDLFGTSVSISGDTALVGAPYYDSFDGAAWVFRRTGTQWAQEDKLVGSSSNRNVGRSVSIEGDTALVGSPYTGFSGPGSVLVFQRAGTVWTNPTALMGAGVTSGDLFGWSVSLSGDKALVGAYEDDEQGGDAGAAYVFKSDGTAWSEVSKLVALDGAQADNFGIAVSLSADTSLVGAEYDDDAGLNSGSAYFFQGLEGSSVGTYCTAGTSASGCQALIHSYGTPSATATWGFSLLVANMEGAKDGLFFYGTNGKQANPWGNGGSYVCVIPPRLRSELLSAFGSTAGACDGVLVQDLNARWCPTCPKPTHNPGAGAVVQAQLWYRDPNNTSNVDTSMSDAIEFTVQP